LSDQQFLSDADMGIAPQPDLSKMSDSDLLTIANGGAPFATGGRVA
jgi:hypothetical protein